MRLTEGELVLCWYEYFRFGSYNRMFQTFGIGCHYAGNWCGEVANGTRTRVIAWMQLPEPYKKKAMEKKYVVPGGRRNGRNTGRIC